MKVLITGGSGLVGTRLTHFLTNKGIEVVWLSRKSGTHNNIVSYEWDYKKGKIDTEVFKDVTHIVHLAGAGVFDKSWTSNYKKEIIDSRIETTRLLFEHIASMKKLTAFICSSAIGWYGNSLGNKKMIESDPPSYDFLSEVAVKWEQAADQFQTKDIRTVKIRIGIALSEKGGALQSMLLPVKFGFGSPLASGKQIISWIHLDDLCGIFIKALEEDIMKGIYNAVAPEPVQNREFMQQCAYAMGRPFFLPHVPETILNIVLGKEKSKSVTQGINVSSEKIQKQDYLFLYPDLNSALKNLIG